ncbi:MAG: hypothetical protein AB1778_08070 [Candidatus Bipolaricaulota bacterium]
MSSALHHVVVEGLPAAGKTESLALLARFYPQRVRVLPELVKSVVEDQGLDLFRDRDRLTAALVGAVERRRLEVREMTAAGFLCLEESHLAVHRAYAVALGDLGFLAAFADLDAAAPRPDLVVTLDLTPSESVARQKARATPQFDVDVATLERMQRELEHWHLKRRAPRIVLDAERPAAALVHDLESALGLTYIAETSKPERDLEVLLLLGRPASGKSEFIDFMRHCPSALRSMAYHIGRFDVLDDFPILWQKFQEDDAWERSDGRRRHSRRCNENYAVADDALWPFLIERLNDLATPHLGRGRTLILEFSRGGPSGYASALTRLADEVLRRASALYLDVSFDESWRRNVARYDEQRRDGILTHSVPREEMERTYGTDDWASLTGGATTGTLNVREHRVPFATLHNEPESKDPAVLGPRYAAALRPLAEAALHRPVDI